MDMDMAQQESNQSCVFPPGNHLSMSHSVLSSVIHNQILSTLTDHSIGSIGDV
jgi:hypothetical protein